MAAGQEPQERRLARAVGAEHGAAPAARDAERDALERRYRLGERDAARHVDAVAEVDVAGDDGHPARAFNLEDAPPRRATCAFVSALGEKISYHE